MTTPIKVVRIQLPEGHVDKSDCESSEDPSGDESKPGEINIVMKTTLTSSPEKFKGFSASKRTRADRSPMSPRKRISGPNEVAFRLDEELEKAAKRRVSEIGTAGLAGGEDNMAQLVASLRRQNDDLRQQLLDSRELNKTIDNSGIEKEEQLRKLAEKECEELRTTVSRLERLINIEREERKVTEKQTLELLEDVKKKWHERTEDRVQKV